RRLSIALADFCTQQHLTLFMVLLSALYTLLYRLTGKDDLIIGSPIAPRNSRELEPLLGFFVNTPALRARPPAEQAFRAFPRRGQSSRFARSRARCGKRC